MRRALVVLLAGWTGAAVVQAARRPMTPADAFALQEVDEIRISPDATTVVFSVVTTDLQANRTTTRVTRVAATGGMPIDLDGIPDDVESLRWSPDSRRLAFFGTIGGRRAVWTYDVAAGRLARVCDHGRSGASAFKAGNALSWSPDGSRLAFAGAPAATRDGRMHIYVVPAIGGAPAALTAGDSDDHSIDWGGDGSEIVFLSDRAGDARAAGNDDIFAVAVGAGRLRRLTNTPGAEREPRMSPDGQWIAYVGEDAHIFAIPIGGASSKVNSGGARELNHALDRPSTALEWAPDGRAIVYTAFDRGKMALYRVSLQGSASVALIDRKAHVGPFSMARDGLIALGLSDPVAPREVYRFRPDADLKPLTSLNGSTIGDWQLVTPEAVHFRNGGGPDVAAWYYPAAGMARPPAGSIPLIVSVHTGPPVAHGYRFNPRLQAQAARGYATLVTYGRGVAGDTDSEDVMALIDHLLRSKPEIDAGRVGITGSHDSGIMTDLLTLPNRFKAAVSFATASTTPPPATDGGATIPTLTLPEGRDPLHDLDRMERSLAWFDRYLGTAGTRPSRH